MDELGGVEVVLWAKMKVATAGRVKSVYGWEVCNLGSVP